MTYNSNFSWNFNIATPPKEPIVRDSDIFAVDHCITFPEVNQLVQVYGRHTGNSALLSNNSHIILPTLEVFDNLSGHIERLLTQYPMLRSDPTAAKQLIENLINAGLTINANNLPIFATNSDKYAQKSLSELEIFILTCDRPELLERLLVSIPTEIRTTYKITILDDSRIKDNAKINRQITTNLKGSLVYFGSHEKQKLITDLVMQLPEAESAIKFLLSGDLTSNLATYGCNRNFALLLSIGKRFVMLDDDVVCEAYKNPNTEKNTKSFSSTNRSAIFYQDDLEWKDLHNQTINPLTEHEKYLGQELGNLQGQVKLLTKDLIGLHLDHIVNKTATSKTVCTINGIVGDPGIGSNNWIFSLDEHSLSEIYSSPDKTKSAFSKRNCMLGRSKLAIVNSVSLLSQFIGLDNSQLLPPFYPNGRNEDFLFGNMLETIQNKNFTIELPFSTPHLPIPKRSWEAPYFNNPLSLDTNYAFGMKTFSLNGSLEGIDSPEKRLDAISFEFKKIANKTLANLTEELVTETINLRASVLEYSYPAEKICLEFEKYFDSFRSINLSRLSASDAVAEFNKYKSTQNSIDVKAYKSSAHQFGNALIHWKAIREASSYILSC